MIEIGNKSKKSNVDKRCMIKWTERWNDVSGEALLHQQTMGKWVDRVFTTAAYDNFVKELCEKIGEPDDVKPCSLQLSPLAK